jgi:hypothetical protein
LTTVALGIEAREIAASESHPIIGWLLTDARKLADPAEFVEAFALRLRRSAWMSRASLSACRFCIPNCFRSAACGNSAKAHPSGAIGRMRAKPQPSPTVRSRLPTMAEDRRATG